MTQAPNPLRARRPGGAATGADRAVKELRHDDAALKVSEAERLRLEAMVKFA